MEDSRNLFPQDRRPDWSNSESILPTPASLVSAESLVKHYQGLVDPRVMFLVIDDNHVKNQTYKNMVSLFGPAVGLGVVAASEYNGEAGTRMLVSIRAAEQSQLTVARLVIYMDGYLGGPFDERGVDVARSMMLQADQQRFEPPFFVGSSTDRVANKALAKLVPERYLGEFTYNTSARDHMTEIKQKLFNLPRSNS